MECVPVRLQREPSDWSRCRLSMVERFWIFHRLALLPIRRCYTTVVDRSINVTSKEICCSAGCFTDLSHIPQVAYGVSEIRGVGFEVGSRSVLGLIFADVKNKDSVSLFQKVMGETSTDTLNCSRLRGSILNLEAL
jgi:hypothetical protein